MASCQSNLKELVLSYLMYAQDYDERPIPDSAGRGEVDRVYWCSGPSTGQYNNTGIPQGLLYPYVKNTGVFYCPSIGGIGTGTGVCSYHYGINRNGATSFHAANASPYGPTWHTKQISDMVEPAKLICFADGGISWHAIQISPATTYPCDRHNEFVNVAFCDGHVKARKLNELLDSVGCCWLANCSY